MLTRKQRCYAIWKCLYFGIVPSCVYEPKCHYANEAEGYPIESYFGHLWMNMLIIKHLLKGTEHPSTHRFHKMKVTKWFRWQHK